MKKHLNIAFIGGGNMATALASGLIGTHCEASDIHVMDINSDTLSQWKEKGATVATRPDSALSAKQIWILSVKPQFLNQAVQSCKPFLTPDTLVVSIAAGISAETLARWLGTPQEPWTRLVRCMPNTPALVGAGATGLLALDGVTDADRQVANQLMGSVGQVVWVDNDAAIDAVTALSGSGPAYVFLFIEALIQGGVQLGLTTDQAHTLALATVNGACQLASASGDDLLTLRQRVTSKGGTTAAALDSLTQGGLVETVNKAMNAAYERAGELSDELSK